MNVFNKMPRLTLALKAPKFAFLRPSSRLLPGLRSFSAEAVPVTKEEETKPMGVLEEYGTLPVIGFASFIMISKEYVIVNEELLLAMLLTNTFFGLYVMLKEPISIYFEDYRKEIETSVFSSYHRTIQGLKDEKADLDALKDFPQAVKDIEEYKAFLEQSAVIARAKKNKSDAATTVIERLERIAAFESDLLHKEKALLRKIAKERFLSNLKNAVTPQVHGKIVDDAIAYLNNPSTVSVASIESALETELAKVSKEISSVDGMSVELKKLFAEDIAEFERQKGFVQRLVSKDL